jgi:hypothetical protein
VKLSEIQRSFARSIKSAEPDIDFLGFIRDTAHATPLVRLEVYRSAYRIRMVESLRDDFGRVEKEIGETEFRKLAEDYLDERPSRYASLAEFSQDFPDFVRGLSPSHYRLASIDWAEILASHAQAIDFGKILLADEIQSGALYRIVQNPTLQFHSDSERPVVAFRSRVGTFTKELVPSELQVLNLFVNGQTPETLNEALTKNKIDENAVLPMISEWVGAEILYCERI